MVVRALLLTLVLALSAAPVATAASPTGGTGTPQKQTGGFGSIPTGEPAPVQAAPPPGSVVPAGSSSTAAEAPHAGSAHRAKAHRAQADDVVEVPVPSTGAPAQTVAPAASAAAGELASTGFDLGMFTALGCLLTALGVGLLAALGPRERF
jgi:hypothetical protein